MPTLAPCFPRNKRLTCENHVQKEANAVSLFTVNAAAKVVELIPLGPMQPAAAVPSVSGAQVLKPGPEKQVPTSTSAEISTTLSTLGSGQDMELNRETAFWQGGV